MQWEKIIENHGYVLLTGRGDDLDYGFREMLDIFWRDITSLPHPNCDFIRVEFWIDSGQVVMFPTSRVNRSRIERGTCQVVSKRLIEEYNRIADGDSTDEQFDAAASRLRWDAIHSFQEIAVASRNESGDSGLTEFLCFEADEQEPLLSF